MWYVHRVAVDNGGSWPAPTVCIYKFLLAGDERSVAPERSTILRGPLRSEWRAALGSQRLVPHRRSPLVCSQDQA